MVFEDNWIVPVLHNGPFTRSQLNPALKLEVLVTEPRQEPYERLYSLNLSYDPQMRADNLVAEMSQQEVADSYFRVVPSQPMQLVRSSEYHTVAEFRFDAADTDKQDYQGEIVLNYKGVRGSSCVDASLLRKENVPVVSEYPYHMILHVFRTFVKSPFWDDLAQRENKYRPNDNQITRVVIRLSEAIADEFTRETGEVFEEPHNGIVRFVSREIAQ